MADSRRKFLERIVPIGVAIEGARAQSGAPVRCRITDSATGRETAARVRLVNARGGQFAPVGHPAALSETAQEGDVRFQNRRFSYVTGAFEIDPRLLPLRYQVIKGFEYTIAEGEITAESARGGAVNISLSRWTSPARDGWYSGDVHIHHISPKTCAMEMEAEDLNIANLLTSDFTIDQAEFEGRVNGNSRGNRLIYVNQEFRNHQLGHMCLLNLKRLVQPVKEVQPYHWPLHLDVCDKTHAQGGYVAWAHFPSWPGVESPLDVAMEKLDGLEILSVLDPLDFPVFLKEVVNEQQPNDGLHLWYRFLNCGFKLAALAGTDKMTNYVTVGANRVYAQLRGAFSYQAWIDALKAGNTFVSNSPMLKLTVDRKPPGATIRASPRRNKAISIHATAESQLRFDRLEILANGVVIGEVTPSGRPYRAEIHLEHPLTRSCWIAARAREDIGPYRARGVEFAKIHVENGTMHGDLYGTRRPETVFAHTSPVYVIRDSEPIRSEEDAEYYVRYLDRSIRWLETQAKFASRQDRISSVEAFKAGRAIYEKRAREARVR